MRYDHPLWNVMMRLFDYTEKQLEEHGKGMMLSEIRGLHQSAVNEFTLHRDRVAEALKYISFEDCVNPLPGLDRLNNAETEAMIAASQGSSLKASSTEAGKKAVQEAQKRLEERERMRPMAEAQSKLDEAEQLRKEKELAAQRDKEEKDRPKRELKEAQKAEQAAEDEVKEAAELVKKAKP